MDNSKRKYYSFHFDVVRTAQGIVYQRWNKLLLRRRINEENLLKAAVQNEVRGKGKLFIVNLLINDSF